MVIIRDKNQKNKSRQVSTCEMIQKQFIDKMLEYKNILKHVTNHRQIHLIRGNYLTDSFSDSPTEILVSTSYREPLQAKPETV